MRENIVLMNNSLYEFSILNTETKEVRQIDKKIFPLSYIGGKYYKSDKIFFALVDSLQGPQIFYDKKFYLLNKNLTITLDNEYGVELGRFQIKEYSIDIVYFNPFYMDAVFNNETLFDRIFLEYKTDEFYQKHTSYINEMKKPKIKEIITDEDMLTTEQLKRYIKQEIYSKEKEVEFSGIRFEVPYELCESGTYVFQNQGEYHICEVGSRNNSGNFTTKDKREILYRVLNNTVDGIILERKYNDIYNNEEYKKLNEEGSKLFQGKGIFTRWKRHRNRKKLFDTICEKATYERYMEVYGKFGKDFEERKRKELDEQRTIRRIVWGV